VVAQPRSKECCAAFRFDDGQARIERIVIEHRVRRFELAEVRGKLEVLGAGDVLVTEKNHAELEQRGPDLGNGSRIERPGQIDACNKGAEVRRTPLGCNDLVAHLHYSTRVSVIVALRAIAVHLRAARARITCS